jgi:hypothetical protein
VRGRRDTTGWTKHGRRSATWRDGSADIIRKCFWLRWHDSRGRLRRLRQLGTTENRDLGVACSSGGASAVSQQPVLNTALVQQLDAENRMSVVWEGDRAQSRSLDPISNTEFLPKSPTRPSGSGVRPFYRTSHTETATVDRRPSNGRMATKEINQATHFGRPRKPIVSRRARRTVSGYRAPNPSLKRMPQPTQEG